MLPCMYGSPQRPFTNLAATLWILSLSITMHSQQFDEHDTPGFLDSIIRDFDLFTFYSKYLA